MNQPRIRAQRAVAVCEGVGYANSPEDWPFDYFDAGASCDEEAGLAQFTVNAHRRHQAALQERRV